MEAALTAAKNEGNALFAAGHVTDAIAAYKRGICLIEADDAAAHQQHPPDRWASEAVSASVRALHVLLYSNMSNAYLRLGSYSESWEAAAAATRVDPHAWKPWLRFIEARRRAGYHFDALVHSLRYLRPLLRGEREQRRLTAAEVTATLSAVEEPLCDELGVLRLSPDIELVEYAGGVAMVSRRHFQPADVLFVEHKYTRADFQEAGLSAQSDLTTESIVGYFADRLRPEQAAASQRWQNLKKDFAGAWPRSDEDIDEDTRDTVGAYLRARFPDVAEDELRELLSTALMCRYNCFHSGFFRACALANHSCHANIAMKYSSVEETVRMVAVDPIEPGELMNVKYLSDAHFLLGVGKRRELLRSWLFWCQCDRCLRDTRPTAVSEFVECAACHAFSHSALMGHNPAADPTLPTSETCRECGAVMAWSPAQRDLLQNELLTSFTGSTSNFTADALREWMRGQLRQTEGLRLHPEHWVYRTLFYFLAVALTSIVDRVAAGLNESRISQVLLDDIKLLFGGCGLQAHYLPRCADARARAGAATELAGVVATDELVCTGGDRGGGCELLKCAVILWQLLVPFYPMNEMWSVNDAICKLVLLQLVVPTPAASLSPALALQLLQRHGHFIGDASGVKWVHSYSMHRNTFNAKEPLPLAKVKKALKGG
ncbi:TPR repeat [Novymonas esmeraldas]|uniref:TPR repeat n=1 Tax=Novymonas esmeraldas TaxID=1808958 RepID=A0AAW0ENX8_9TRYP